jgi:hypothetical protein
MTYHALENRLRKWKKEATALKDEAAGVPAPAKSPVKPKVKKDAIPQKNGESHSAMHCAISSDQMLIDSISCRRCQGLARHEDQGPRQTEDQGRACLRG